MNIKDKFKLICKNCGCEDVEAKNDSLTSKYQGLNDYVTEHCTIIKCQACGNTFYID